MKYTWNQLDTKSIKTVLRSEVKALREYQPTNRSWLSSHFYEAFEQGFQACEKVSRIVSKALPSMHSGSRPGNDLLQPAASLLETYESVFNLVIELGEEIGRKVDNGRSEMVAGKVALVKRHFLEMCKRCHYTHYDARRYREIKSAPPSGIQTKSPSPTGSLRPTLRKSQHETYKPHKFEKQIHQLEQKIRKVNLKKIAGSTHSQRTRFSSTRVKLFLIF